MLGSLYTITELQVPYPTVMFLYKEMNYEIGR